MSNIAKRTVQAAGWITIVFGILLLIFAVKAEINSQQIVNFVPCTGPAWSCELQNTPIPVDQYVGFYVALVGILLCFFGNRIRQVNRKDTSFYLITGFIIDITLFSGILAEVTHAFDNEIIQALLFLLILIHTLCVFALIAWYRYKTKENPNLIPGASWWIKIVILLFVVSTSVVLWVIRFLLG